MIADGFVTFDEKLDELLDAKRKLAQDMLNGSAEVAGSEFADAQDARIGSAFLSLPVIAFEKQELA